MGRIRSAWEIALERTESIEIDADRIRHNATLDEIRRIAGAFLLADEDTEAQTREKLSAYSCADVKEGLSQTILNGLVLSAEQNENDQRPQRTAVLLDIALPGDASAMDYFSQILQHIQQYPLHRAQLLQQLKDQYEPMLQQKAQKMKEQYGEEVPVSFEQDKECLQIASQYMDKLTEQYQSTLDQAKEKMKVLLS